MEPIQFIISQFKLVHTPNSDIRYNPELISKYIAFLSSLKTILLSSRDVDVTNLPILKRYLQEWLSKHDSLSITSKDHPLYAKFCESLDSLNETLNQISSINDTHRIFDQCVYLLKLLFSICCFQIGLVFLLVLMFHFTYLHLIHKKSSMSVQHTILSIEEILRFLFTAIHIPTLYWSFLSLFHSSQ